jgi:GNAT superfamily N-acetyltransferase
VRHVLSAEHERLRSLRLAALRSSPEAFGSTHAGNLRHPAAFWERGARASERGLDERTFLLVDSEDRWLGMAFARLDSDGAPSAWLGGMWVAPDARRQGGAALLCEACITWARERGAADIALTVVVGNEVAKRCYEAAGFTVRDKALRTYGDRRLQEFVMGRAL